MKKLKIAAAALCALLLCSCVGAKSADELSDTIQSALEDAVAQAESEAAAEPATEQPATEQPATEEPAPTPYTAPAAQDGPAPIEPGTVDESGYSSDFLSLRFTPPDGWSVWKWEDFSGNAAGPGTMADYESGGFYIDLWAQDESGNQRVQVMIEERPLRLSDGYELKSSYEYMDYTASSVSQTTEAMGLHVASAERYSVEYLSDSFEVFRIVTDTNSLMTQTMLTADRDGFMLTIHVTCVGEDATEDILAMFGKY